MHRCVLLSVKVLLQSGILLHGRCLFLFDGILLLARPLSGGQFCIFPSVCVFRPAVACSLLTQHICVVWMAECCIPQTSKRLNIAWTSLLQIQFSDSLGSRSILQAVICTASVRVFYNKSKNHPPICNPRSPTCILTA